jgi:tyrocidine synthetase-3
MESFSKLYLNRDYEIANDKKEFVNYREYLENLFEINSKQKTRYWKEYFKGYSPNKKLKVIGLEDMKECREKFLFQTISEDLNEGLTKDLNSLAKSLKITLNAIFLGAWGYCLSKYLDEQDLLFGYIGSGRSETFHNVDKLVGMFVNPLPARIIVNPNMKVKDWLIDIFNQSIESQNNQFHLTTQSSGIALNYDSLCVYENYPMDVFDGRGKLKMKFGNVVSYVASSYPLTIEILRLKSCLKLSLRYNSKEFTFDGIQRVLANIKNVLLEFVKKTDEYLAHVSIADKESGIASLVSAGLTNIDANHLKKNAYTLFKESVGKYADEVAVLDGKMRYSYRDIDQMSDELNYIIGTFDSEEEGPIGILCENSVWLIIAIYGVIKSGRPFVPINIQDPNERILNIVAELNIKLMVTTMNFNAGRNVKVVNPKKILFRGLVNDRERTINSSELLYIINTSGTTGKQKFISITHRNLVNYLLWARKYYITSLKKCALLFSSPSFDLTLTSIFLPLTSGNYIRIMPQSKSPLKDALCEKVNMYEFLKLTPSHLKLLDRQILHKNKLPKTLILGGENIPSNLLDKEIIEKTAVINEYGPTETTIGSSVYKVSVGNKDLERRGPIPIGKPISNTALVVLDRYYNILSRGVIGEIYIGGEGVARGYYNNPTLTALNFIPNPCKHLDCTRMYRTGDLGYMDSNNDLILTGRIDDQLKVNGNRVELGEIEWALSRLTEIKTSITFPYEGNSLIAFVVINDGSSFQEEDLKNKLAKMVPSYMVPNDIILIEKLPLAPNGKVDKSWLINKYKSVQSKKVNDGDTNIIQELQEIWQVVLKQERIPVDKHFYELGGDSISALLICSQAKSKGLNLQPFQILELGRIDRIADSLSSEIPLRKDQQANKDYYGVTTLQRCYLDSNNGKGFNYNIEIDILKGIDREDLKLIVRDVIEGSDIFAISFVNNNGKACQVKDPNKVDLNITYKDLSSEINKEKLYEQFKKERNLFISVKQNVLYGFSHIKLSSNKSRLLIVIHHLISDFYSCQLIGSSILKSLNSPKVIKPGIDKAGFLEWIESNQFNPTISFEKVEKKWIDRKVNKKLKVGGFEYTSKLSKKLSQGLHKLNSESKDVHMESLLLSSLILSVQNRLESKEINVGMERNSRLYEKKVDISNSLGWFTMIVPLTYRLRKNAKAHDVITDISRLNARNLDASINSMDIKYDIIFNYLDRPFDEYESNYEISTYFEEKILRDCPLEVNIWIKQGVFNIHWIFHPYLSHQARSIVSSFEKNMGLIYDEMKNYRQHGIFLSDSELQNVVEELNVERG